MDILQQIYDVNNKCNPVYNERHLSRQVIKIGEESGEISEAFLSVTSDSNGKNKTFTDVREEAVDTAIVGLDIALTKFPGEEDWDDERLYVEVESMIAKKLAKWKNKIRNNTTII